MHARKEALPLRCPWRAASESAPVGGRASSPGDATIPPVGSNTLLDTRREGELVFGRWLGPEPSSGSSSIGPARTSRPSVPPSDSTSSPERRAENRRPSRPDPCPILTDAAVGIRHDGDLTEEPPHVLQPVERAHRTQKGGKRVDAHHDGPLRSRPSRADSVTCLGLLDRCSSSKGDGHVTLASVSPARSSTVASAPWRRTHAAAAPPPKSVVGQ